VDLRTAEGAVWASVGVDPASVVEHRAGGVRVQEVGAGPPVLFVHGASNSGISWAPLVARLPGVRCLVVDRPGCGLSPALPSAFSGVDDLARFADGFVASVLDGLGVEVAAVVGTSLGGYLSLRAAAASPERVDGVVLFGWTVGAPMARLPLAMRLSAVPGLGRLTARVPPTRSGVRAILRQVGLRDALASGAFSDVMLDSYVALLRETDTMANETAVMAKVFSARRGTGAIRLDPATLGDVGQPVGWLWGRSDPFGGEEAAAAFTSSLPRCELTMVDGGHAVWIDDPSAAAAAVQHVVAS
jgi:pimeloyl-ACP methyl ester carboxylesterase